MKINPHIQEPCQADLSDMTRCGNKIYCTHCEKHVTDLSKADSNEVETFLVSNVESCVILHNRHEATEKQRFAWINRTETFLLGWRLRKIAYLLTSLLLLLTSCFHRRPRHTAGKYNLHLKTEQKHQINQHNTIQHGKEDHQ